MQNTAPTAPAHTAPTSCSNPIRSINPDPERIFYAHNTFVQSYLEMGPLGALGMLSIPLITLTAALIARRDGAVPARRALLSSFRGCCAGRGVQQQFHQSLDQLLVLAGRERDRNRVQ